MGQLQIPTEAASFKPNSGRVTVKLFGFKGTVMGGRAWSETEVHSHATLYPTSMGGKVGLVAGPRVESRVTEKLELFLRDARQEQAFRLDNSNFPVREGHEVALVWAIPSDKDRGPIIWARNCTTGATVELPPGDEFIAAAEYTFPKLVAFLHLPLFGLAFISLPLAFALGSTRNGGIFVVAALILCGLSAWRVLRLRQIKETFLQRMRERLEAIGQIIDGSSVRIEAPQQNAHAASA